VIRLVTGFFLSLLSFMTYAAVGQDAAATVELPPPDATGLVVFLVVMVAMIGGYVWYVHKQERARKQHEGEQQ
jgi:uncharacterized protein HemX